MSHLWPRLLLVVNFSVVKGIGSTQARFQSYVETCGTAIVSVTTSKATAAFSRVSIFCHLFSDFSKSPYAQFERWFGSIPEFFSRI